MPKNQRSEISCRKYLYRIWPRITYCPRYNDNDYQLKYQTVMKVIKDNSYNSEEGRKQIEMILHW